MLPFLMAERSQLTFSYLRLPLWATMAHLTEGCHEGVVTLEYEAVKLRRWRKTSRIRKTVHSWATLLRFTVPFVVMVARRTLVSAYHYSSHPSRQRRLPHRISSNENRVVMAIGTRLAARDGDSLDTEYGDYDDDDDDENVQRLFARVAHLEEYVAKQETEIKRLQKQCNDLVESTLSFARVVKLLTDAGLADESMLKEIDPKKPVEEIKPKPKPSKTPETPQRVVESFDNSLIFGTAPSQICDAADAAGASILAAVLAGKQRMLVDVRDAELSSDNETLVQFIELAILPIAAGLEGLTTTRNRVKIVFPKVSQLLEYRRTMALASPEVVALSTLGFDPVEKRDKLVVIIAPSPDDDEGLSAMIELLAPTDPNLQPIQQPVVILNYHMVPVAGISAIDFETVYHLRLLSVQYMSGDNAEDFFRQVENDMKDALENQFKETGRKGTSDSLFNRTSPDDAALEAAMKRAREVGMNQGVTRGMVIRAYPRPWHVFVDTSPGTDSDYEVAAIFDEEPSQDELNFAIVECLEGSEKEDEIVAQQMQQALEEGQLDNLSVMIGEALGNLDSEIKKEYTEDSDDEYHDDADDDDEDPYSDFDMYEEDSV